MVEPATFGIMVGALLVALLGVVIAHRLWSRRAGSVRSLREKLRRRVLGDDRTVDRLVDYERQRRPHASEAELLQSALQRLERDNR